MSSSPNPPRARHVRTIEYDRDELWRRFWWGVGVGALLVGPTMCWLGSMLGHLVGW